MTERSADIGQRLWFKAIVGALGLVVVGLVALAAYSIAPLFEGSVRVTPALLSTAIMGLAVFGAAFAISRSGQRRTRPS